MYAEIKTIVTTKVDVNTLDVDFSVVIESDEGLSDDLTLYGAASGCQAAAEIIHKSLTDGSGTASLGDTTTK